MIAALEKLRQENLELEARLGYVARLCQKKKRKEKGKEARITNKALLCIRLNGDHLPEKQVLLRT
jgi:hypothetical protein